MTFTLKRRLHGEGSEKHRLYKTVCMICVYDLHKELPQYDDMAFVLDGNRISYAVLAISKNMHNHLTNSTVIFPMFVITYVLSKRLKNKRAFTPWL